MMRHSSKTKALAAAVFAIGALCAAGLAQARTDVHWSVSIGLPLVPVYVEPVPAAVYVPPPPPPRVYVQPMPVYVPAPPPVYGYRYPTRWDRDADGVPDRYEHRRSGRHADHDRDGVPDRYDRRPGDPWRY